MGKIKCSYKSATVRTFLCSGCANFSQVKLQFLQLSLAARLALLCALLTLPPRSLFPWTLGYGFEIAGGQTSDSDLKLNNSFYKSYQKHRVGKHISRGVKCSTRSKSHYNEVLTGSKPVVPPCRQITHETPAVFKNSDSEPKLGNIKLPAKNAAA